MNDMSAVIVPKSDQMNAEDFLAGPTTYTIETVDIRPDTEQPVSIHLAGEKRVWRPCKSMSRVLVAAWGPDANVYTGRSVTLFHDRTVKWGGMEVGGIRISHLSHLDRDMQIALTETRGKRKPFVVRVLEGSAAKVSTAKPQMDKAGEGARALFARVHACQTIDDIRALTADETVIKQRKWLTANRPELAERIDTAVNDLLALFEPSPEAPTDDFPGVVTPREPPDDDSILPPSPLADMREMLATCATNKALDACMQGATWRGMLKQLSVADDDTLRQEVSAKRREFRAAEKSS